MKPLTNKTALITGAAGLLGPHHSAALAEIGFNLVLIDLNKKKLDIVCKELNNKFKRIRIIKH